MGTSGSGQGDVFDVRKIRRLVELMNEHELAEIDLRQGDQRIRMRRDMEPLIVPGRGPAPPPPNPSPSAPVSGPAPSTPSTDDANIVLVKSPMVGTYYSAASPDAPPYVKPGDEVHPESTVCIVEAMKVFNEIPAECSGKIVAALCENGDPVEFGQPLFKVDTSA